jgi:hypothetical protein
MMALDQVGRSAGDILNAYGMRQVARFFLREDAFIIEIKDCAAVELPLSIYAFVIDDEIVRVGSSSVPLRDRLDRWQRDITAAIRGRRSSTPSYEAAAWKRRLEDFGEGHVFSRQAQEVSSPIGRFRTLLDEERVLIERHRPPMNRSNR